MAQISARHSLYPHCLMHNVRLLSVKHFTFRLIYRTRASWACISGVRISKLRVRRNSGSVGSVEKWVRANDMHCTCTALAHAARGAVAWSVSRRDTFCQSFASLYALNEALIRGSSASPEKMRIRVPRPQSSGHWRKPSE